MKKVLLLLVLIGGAAAGGVWWFQQRSNAMPAAVAYTVLPIEHGPLVETVSATGVIQPRQVYSIGTEVSGRVMVLLADFNQEVREGDILFRIDDQTLRRQREQARSAIEASQAGADQARAARDTAKKALDEEQALTASVRRETRVQILTGQLNTTEAAFKGALVKITQAEQALALADLLLERTIVRVPAFRSPVDKPCTGSLSDEKSASQRKYLVLDRKVSLGQMVAPPLSAHLLTLAGSLDVVQIEAQVAEGDIGKVTRGLEAEFTVASYSEPESIFRGKVTDVRLLPVNDRGAVFYKVILEAENKADSSTGRWCLTPGLTATVEIVRRKHDKVWKMPAMALSFQPEEARLSEAAREKLRRWQEVKDRDNWRPVWVLNENRTPWPLFVRVGGTGPEGQTGIRDLSFTEVLEWDSELNVKPVAGRPETYPEVIIAAPPAKSGGFSLKF